MTVYSIFPGCRRVWGDVFRIKILVSLSQSKKNFIFAIVVVVEMCNGRDGCRHHDRGGEEL